MRHLLTSFTLLAFLISCKSSGTAQSTSELHAEGSRGAYLALGDSIAFGHNPTITMNRETVDQGRFPGYPEEVGQALGMTVTNPACIGETTASFLNSSVPDNGCRSGSEPFHPFVKAEYTESQMDFAKSFIKAHPETRLVTISLGGNDLLMVQDACDKTLFPSGCKVAKLPGAAYTVGSNISSIINGLRDVGYKGQIVIVTQYATNYSDTVQKLALGSINAELGLVARTKGVSLASGYDAMKAAAGESNGDSCKAGLLIVKTDGTCDYHVSDKGRQVLVQAVLKVIQK